MVEEEDKPYWSPEANKWFKARGADPSRPPPTWREWIEIGRLQARRNLLEKLRNVYLKRAEMGERKAYIEAINIVTNLLWELDSFKSSPDNEHACNWLHDLSIYLKDLDTGIVPSIFRPRQEGRRGLSTPEWMKRMWAVCAVELLHATGMKYESAAKRVARSKQYCWASESDLLSWQKEFKKGAVKSPWAVEVYEDEMAWIRDAGAEDIQDLIRREKIGE